MGAFMWFPGHLAFSLLICLPFIVYLRRERALALSFLGVFALLPDYAHVGDLRGLSHSLIGLGATLAIVLFLLAVAFRPRLSLILLGVVAASSHLLADGYIGTVTPFYPWDTTWYQVHVFNSAFDIRTELVLFALAAVIVIAMNPLEAVRSLPSYSDNERKALLVTSSLMIAMCGLQGAYFVMTSQASGWDIFRSLLLLAFIVSGAVSSLFFIKILLKKGQKESIMIAIK